MGKKTCVGVCGLPGKIYLVIALEDMPLSDWRKESNKAKAFLYKDEGEEEKSSGLQQHILQWTPSRKCV